MTNLELIKNMEAGHRARRMKNKIELLESVLSDLKREHEALDESFDKDAEILSKEAVLSIGSNTTDEEIISNSNYAFFYLMDLDFKTEKEKIKEFEKEKKKLRRDMII